MGAKLVGVLAVLVLLAAPAFAYSGFPTPHYPANQYGLQSSYYGGAWGSVTVHGSYSYYPNGYGYRPYGYRVYGHVYTPTDLRYGGSPYYRGW